jgi:hypothetical protein
MSILNEDNLEPNKPDPEYRGGGTVLITVQEINIASPILITIRHTYFLLDVDNGGIRYVANTLWKDIYPHYYSEIFRELQEKEGGQGFTADYNSSQTTKYIK